MSGPYRGKAIVNAPSGLALDRLVNLASLSQGYVFATLVLGLLGGFGGHTVQQVLLGGLCVAAVLLARSSPGPTPWLEPIVRYLLIGVAPCVGGLAAYSALKGPELNAAGKLTVVILTLVVMLRMAFLCGVVGAERERRWVGLGAGVLTLTLAVVVSEELTGLPPTPVAWIGGVGSLSLATLTILSLHRRVRPEVNDFFTREEGAEIEVAQVVAFSSSVVWVLSPDDRLVPFPSRDDATRHLLDQGFRSQERAGEAP